MTEAKEFFEELNSYTDATIEFTDPFYRVKDKQFSTMDEVVKFLTEIKNLYDASIITEDRKYHVKEDSFNFMGDAKIHLSENPHGFLVYMFGGQEYETGEEAVTEYLSTLRRSQAQISQTSFLNIGRNLISFKIKGLGNKTYSMQGALNKLNDLGVLLPKIGTNVAQDRTAAHMMNYLEMRLPLAPSALAPPLTQAEVGAFLPRNSYVTENDAPGFEGLYPPHYGQPPPGIDYDSA